MIVLKNLEKVLGEGRTQPIDRGGELEKHISEFIPSFLMQNFGIQCVVEIKKE